MNDFKEFEKQAWERKARRYAGSWGSVTDQPIDAILDHAAVGQGTRLLDCGCGPGSLCAAAWRRGAKVVGCDYSPAMVSIARAAHPGITFVARDVESLTFGDGEFDAVTLNYLLLHTARPETALTEAARVLRSSGMLVYTVWCPPERSPGFDIIMRSIKQFADQTVVPPAPDPFAFAHADTAIDTLTPLGFTEIMFTEYPTQWVQPSADTFFEALQAGTRIGGMIELQSPETKAKIRDAIITAIGPYKTAEGVVVPAPSMIVSARKM